MFSADFCLLSFLLSGIRIDQSTSNFAVQRQSDQTIEQTANRDSKTKGGITGFSMNPASVHRGLMSQSERAYIAIKCKYMAGIQSMPRFVHLLQDDDSLTQHSLNDGAKIPLLFALNGLFFLCRKRKDLYKSKCQRHEKAVQDVISSVSQIIHPFEVDQEKLLSLSGGAVLENDTANFLLNAEQFGEAQFTEFAQTYLFPEKSDIFTSLKKTE